MNTLRFLSILRHLAEKTTWILRKSEQIVPPPHLLRPILPEANSSGSRISQMERQPIIWPIFPENYMKMKKLWAPGGGGQFIWQEIIDFSTLYAKSCSEQWVWTGVVDGRIISLQVPVWCSTSDEYFIVSSIDGQTRCLLERIVPLITQRCASQIIAIRGFKNKI